ncbi:MAG: DUF484 family protein [Candidatus Symbiobacter sp.]|nr:DUF484 family protein [Candidatus Symbiobacter sp.]
MDQNQKDHSPPRPDSPAAKKEPGVEAAALSANPSEALGAAPSEALGAAPSEALGAAPSEALGATPSEALGAMPSEALGAMPRPNLPPPRLQPPQVAEYLAKNPQFLAAYLPDFIEKNPHFWQNLRTQAREFGPDIVDFRQVLIEKLQNDLTDLRQTQRKMIAVARHNLAGQNRVHQAILGLMQAQSFEEFIALVTEDLAMMLDVDAVSLCLEESPPPGASPGGAVKPTAAAPRKKPPHLRLVGQETIASAPQERPTTPPEQNIKEKKTAAYDAQDAQDAHSSRLIAGVRILPPGFIQQTLGSAKILLRADLTPDPADPSGGHDRAATVIYGHKAVGLVRSDALALLDFTRHDFTRLDATELSDPNNAKDAADQHQNQKQTQKPGTPPPVLGPPVVGLLALGARRPGVYHPGQSTELVHFLAEFIVANVRRWLAQPSHLNLE